MNSNRKRLTLLVLSGLMSVSLYGVPAAAEDFAELEIIEDMIVLDEIAEEEPAEETEESAELEAEVQEAETLAAETAIEITGDGTVDNPYLICTEEQLLAIATGELTNALSSNYELMNNIVIEDTTTWVPIGHSTGFSGTFDGNGYTVSNVVLEGSGYAYTGFFGINRGLIENLTVEVNFSATGITGGLAAYSSGTIQNCLSEGTVTSTGGGVGGLVGQNEKGNISTSGSLATVSGDNNVGGLIGHNYALHADVLIINCYAQGNVTGNSRAGGLIGHNDEYYGVPTVRNCYASGKANDGTAAGLIGSNEGRIYNCYYRYINTGNKLGYSATTAEMKVASTFYGWDFDHIWAIDGGYPYIDLRGTPEAVVFEGGGSASNPYLIKTEKDLYWLAMDDSGMYLNNDTVYFQLANNIEITTENWTPIGYYHSFKGVFDGNGYTVSGVSHPGTAYDVIGLFAHNSGTIRNLTVEGNITGIGRTGLLAGYNSGTIENCLSRGTVTSTGDHVGGLIGQNEKGNISTSGSLATVTGRNNVGGLIGHNYALHADVLVINCYAQGNVTGNSAVGGLIGHNDEYYGTPTVRYCYASGKANDGTAAGLIGSNEGRVYNCYYRSINTGNKVGYALSVAELRAQASYYFWDFDNIWEINGGYPYINVRGKTPAITFDGDGDFETPYFVETEEQLYALSMGVAKTGEKIYYQLVNDIEITAKYWKPIGYYESFIGVFDGNGYTISGVSLAGTDHSVVGLFAHNAGTIKNLTVEGNITGIGRTGLLAGYNSGMIESCFSRGTVTSTGDSVGGLVGQNEKGNIRTSGSYAAVTGRNNVGGLIGHNYAQHTDVLIINCYAQGNVTGSNAAGGLIGHNDEYYGVPTVRYCYASGMVNEGTAAGLIGSNEGRVYNCYYYHENIGNMVGYALSLEEMYSEDSYYFWDFENIWEIDNGYPTLNIRGTTPTIEFEGEGDDEIPYMIETEEQLYALSIDLAKTGEKIHYQLANDIKLTAKYWMPIGYYINYIGVFDGNGYTISGVNHSGTDFTGVGLFANNSGIIQNLTVEGAVEGHTYDVSILVARNYGTIQNCMSYGTVKCNGENAGGIVGNNHGIVQKTASFANIIGNSDVGGLVGQNSDGTITNSYAFGNVTGTSRVGGLVGHNSGNPTVQYCYSKGYVTGSGGGLIGNNGGTVTACYYDTETSSKSDTNRGTPMSTEEMKLASTYAGWDFDTVWAISSAIGDGYPYLQAIIPVEKVDVTGVTLDKTSLTLTVGDKDTLTAAVIPDDATDTGVIWKSSNTSVATVSDGVVTAVSAGEAKITATTEDGGYTASCIVTVENDILYGDVNDDGEVNTLDRMTLSRHLADWPGYDTINTEAADVNKDGDVDTLDRMILARNLANWPGYEELPRVQ